MDIKVLRPEIGTFYFLPRHAATQDDSEAAKGAQVGGEAGAAAEGPTGSTAGGGGAELQVPE
jgi:hypothetical protein